VINDEVRHQRLDESTNRHPGAVPAAVSRLPVCTPALHVHLQALPG